MTTSQTQPTGLYWLFMTEMWERFGFYTIQTIAALYLTQGLKFSDTDALLTVSGINSLMYLTPVIGGMMADKLLGYQRSILFGGVLFAIGYLCMALPEYWYFILGAAIVITANGYFKPNVSSIVGDLYQQDDSRRDGGFTIFYMGINIGALLPSLFIGIVVAKYGWHFGFIVAAIGMLLSLITFQLGKKHYREKLHKEASQIKKVAKIQKWLLTAALSLILIIAAFLLFKAPIVLNLVVIIGTVLFSLYTIFILFTLEKDAKRKMLACLILIFISIAFWALYNQTFGSLMLFANRNMAQSFLGIPITAENTQFFNPFFIIVLTPILALLWVKLGKKGLNPSIALKFSYAIWLMTLGFAVLWFGISYFNTNGITASGWLVLSYFLQTTGELLISPVGLAMITVLSPKGYTGMMMGMWFLSQTAAFSISGFLGVFVAIPNGSSILEASKIYESGFGYFALISLIAAIISLLLVPYLKSLTEK